MEALKTVSQLFGQTEALLHKRSLFKVFPKCSPGPLPQQFPTQVLKREKLQAFKDLPFDLRAFVENLGIVSHHAVGVFRKDTDHLEADTFKGEFKALGELANLLRMEVGNNVVVVHVVKVVLERVLPNQCFSISQPVPSKKNINFSSWFSNAILES